MAFKKKQIKNFIKIYRNIIWISFYSFKIAEKTDTVGHRFFLDIGKGFLYTERKNFIVKKT